MDNKHRFFITGLLWLIMTLAAAPAVPRWLFFTADRCIACHNQLSDQRGNNISIGDNWQSSMMANSARDPYWQAAVRREIMVHPSASNAIQNECSACHMPMSRYMAKIQGRMGEVLAHLPVQYPGNEWSMLARDGVSCTLCHQITPRGLGKPESFTAGFVIDPADSSGRHPVYGTYEIDEGRTQIMRSSSEFTPQPSEHIQSSEFCATCHTLITHTLNAAGEVIGELPEQVPYLEWKHSAYHGRMQCQSCHMPEAEGKVKISGVLGDPHPGVSRHVFRGGNFLLPWIFNRYWKELGVAALPQGLDTAAEQTGRHLETQTAKIRIVHCHRETEGLELAIEVINQAGHKLPTAYPSRRVWIHLTVADRNGKKVFESGALNPDGSIAGNDNDQDPLAYETHHVRIDRPDQVQIYENIMVDFEDRVTTVLLSGLRYIKDNRLLPGGFEKGTADPDCAVYGAAAADDDFTGDGDRIYYRIAVQNGESPFRIKAELWYQPIGFRWAMNLKNPETKEGNRFVGYYRDLSPVSGKILCRAEEEVK